MTTTTEAQRKYRAKMRKDGYVLKHIWILPEKWVRIKKYLARQK